MNGWKSVTIAALGLMGAVGCGARSELGSNAGEAESSGRCPCTDRVCRPVILAANQLGPLDIAVDRTNL